MKWYDSYKYRPKHGTKIFLWDYKDQKQILRNALWDPINWHMIAPNFPIFAYVFEDEPPERYVWCKNPFLEQPTNIKQEDIKDSSD